MGTYSNRNSFANSRFTEESEPTAEDIVEAIQDAINKNPKAFIGELGLNGEFERYTVKAGGKYEDCV